MANIQIDIPEAVFQDFVAIAQRSSRDPMDVVREALLAYRNQHVAPSAPLEPGHSLLDHKPISVGKILKPWSSRSEMLEDFFDRD
jgi:hypothetical protein